VVEYYGRARRRLVRDGFSVRPQLNSGTLGGRTLMTYRALGYWREPLITWLPEERRFDHQGWSEATWRADPARLIDEGNSPDPMLLTYLRQGRELAAWRGLSYCRLQCGIDDSEMGHRDFTDGTWVWPEGLVHYVERHRVRLPREFSDIARARGGMVPDVILPERPEGGHLVDRTFLNEWYAAEIGVP
jgi:hypothetical protein